MAAFDGGSYLEVLRELVAPRVHGSWHVAAVARRSASVAFSHEMSRPPSAREGGGQHSRATVRGCAHPGAACMCRNLWNL